ncbi:MAG: uroporphyrinogen-III synthase [Fimbriimonas sp.]
MSKPLAGKTILVTRPAKQAAGLVEPLVAQGATVFTLPAIEIAPPEDPAPFDEALRNLGRYDWIVLTSVNGVDALSGRLTELGLPIHPVLDRRLAVVGPATADAVRRAFREPDLIPTEYVSDAVADAMGPVAGLRFLLPRADIARKELPTILRKRGAVVDDVAAYQIVRPRDETPLPDQAPDMITLTSSSAVYGTRDALAARGKEAWMREARLACIGPITAATVRDLGYEVAVMAEAYTIAGLVDALVKETALA